MKRIVLAVAMLLTTVGVTRARASSIDLMSSLSGFDVANRTGTSCDGFEIDLSGVSPNEVFHTFRNPDFGAPSVSANGSDTKVVYKGHKTDPDTVEHFGVSLSSPASNATYRWKSGSSDCGGASSDVAFPHEAEALSGDTVNSDIRNDSPDGKPVWVQRRVLNANRGVSLEELQTDNPVYTDSSEVDSSPEKLDPNETLSHDDSLDPQDKVESIVEKTDVYADDNGQPGALIGTMLHATVLSSSSTSACSNNLASLKISPKRGKGGAVRPRGVVRLTSAAPSGGEVILLSSDTPSAASVPTTLTIPSGSKIGKFQVTTHPVSEAETVDIKATCGSIDRETPLTLTK